jgi:hypothetical protein
VAGAGKDSSFQPDRREKRGQGPTKHRSEGLGRVHLAKTHKTCTAKAITVDNTNFTVKNLTREGAMKTIVECQTQEELIINARDGSGATLSSGKLQGVVTSAIDHFYGGQSGHDRQSHRHASYRRVFHLRAFISSMGVHLIYAHTSYFTGVHLSGVHFNYRHAFHKCASFRHAS